MNKIRFEKYSTAMYLLLLTAGALMVHGYHPYVEDAEIYLPGVEQLLNPRLFPVGREFFQSHASMTLFPNLVAGFLRVTHVPFESGLFVLHAASIFLFLLACWQLSGLLFPSSRARWAGVCLVAALLTLPVSGTALYIMDQYLNPRNLIAFAGILAVVSAIKKKYFQVFLWLIVAACVHPLMWVFPASFCALWFVLGKMQGHFGLAAAEKVVAVPTYVGLLLLPLVEPGYAQYHEAARLHANHYIQNWEWYEWLGAVGPLLLFWLFERIAVKQRWTVFARAARTFLIYGAIYLLMALLLDLPARFERLARIPTHAQPAPGVRVSLSVYWRIDGRVCAERARLAMVVVVRAFVLWDVRSSTTTLPKERSRGVAGNGSQEPLGFSVRLDPRKHAGGRRVRARPRLYAY